jgi:hypothetical protein
MMLWVVCVVWLLFSAVVIVRNALSLVWTIWSKKNTWLIPIVGGVFGAMGCLVCPDERVNALWPIPLISDMTISILFGPITLLSMLFPQTTFPQPDANV